MSNRPKKLIYILGGQRSGTTALEYVLSSNAQLFACGELMLLEHYIDRNPHYQISKWRCTCGAPIEECSFWSRILSRMESEFGCSKYDVKTHIKNNQHMTREGYRSYLRNLYETLSSEVGATIVDSSKNLNYLQELYEALPDWEISVVYVLRDPLQVALSDRKWHRKLGNRYPPIWRFLLKWSIVNARNSLYVNKLKRSRGECVSVLKYSEFTEAEELDLSDIIRGFDGDTSLSRTVELRKLHTVAGTPTRFDKDLFTLSSRPITHDLSDDMPIYSVLSKLLLNIVSPR